jgi:hypothetical protein
MHRHERIFRTVFVELEIKVVVFPFALCHLSTHQLRLGIPVVVHEPSAIRHGTAEKAITIAVLDAVV